MRLVACADAAPYTFGVTCLRILALAAWLAPLSAVADPAPAPAPAQPHGLTLEAGLGLGVVRTMDPYSRFDSPLYALSLGAGAWLTPRTTLTARVLIGWHGVVSGDDSSDYRYIVAGPSLQHWLTERIWAAVGAGLAVYQSASDGSDDFHTSAGLGLDARFGVLLYRRANHALHVTLELAPAAYRHVEVSLPPPPAETKTFVVGTVTLGYQFL